MFRNPTFTHGAEGQMWQLCALLSVPYLASALVAMAVRIHVAMPWEFVLASAGVGVPYAYCLVRGLFLMKGHLDGRSTSIPPIGMALGMVGLCCLPRLGDQPWVVFALFCTLITVDLPSLPHHYLRNLMGALVALGLGLGVVCNLNYLLAPSLAAGLEDPALMRADMAIYEWLAAPPIEYRDLFPLADSQLFFGLLDTAYLTLFAEIFVVILALLWAKRYPCSFLRALVLCYLVGVIVFYCYPAVGPCIYYPESFRAEFHSTATYRLMQQLTTEFTAATRGSVISGFAYFIALPSLHAALALLCQYFLSPLPLLFWAFLPVNILIVLSTVLLGYHYIVDVPVGLVLACAAILVVRRHAVHLGTRVGPLCSRRMGAPWPLTAAPPGNPTPPSTDFNPGRS